MFLRAVMERNAPLVDAAVELHRDGAIPPGTFVIDVDAVAANAAAVAGAAAAAGVRLYFMTKQIGRNPMVAETVRAHIDAAVAVDVDDADALHAAGVPLGHVGHLVQTPTCAVERMLGYEPEVVTVFSVEKARQIAAIACRSGREQALLLRVADVDDEFFPGQEGGIAPERIAAARAEIDALDGVRVVGVTTYPTVRFDGAAYRPTRNLSTLRRAAELLAPLEQVNAPGHTSVDTLPLVAAAGATHAEPGHALTGTTPRAAVAPTPEVPAVCFLSEVSHVDDEHAWVFGGGFYERGRAERGLLVREHDEPAQLLPLVKLPKGSIDYYRRLRLTRSTAVSVGDSAVFSFRFQAFTSRARIAVIGGLRDGRWRLLGLHDVHGRTLAHGAEAVGRGAAQALGGSR
ncbi:MAG TPA: alanine racemase [Conexibacter sp.]